ncbi:MAG: hypothetical protein ACP5VN_07875 [Acidobacteriota bacterium]
MTGGKRAEAGGRRAALLGLLPLLWALGAAPGSLALRLTLPYAATAPGEELVVFAVLRNRGNRPLPLPAFAVRLETEVEGKRVVLLDRPAPAAGGAGLPLLPGESRPFRFALPLDRRLFLPGRYPLRVHLVPGEGPPLVAEAAFTVRYTRVFYY